MELPAARNSTTFCTLLRMVLSSSVIVGRSATGLIGPKAGTMRIAGATFPMPREDIIFTNCSLVTASIAFTIWMEGWGTKQEANTTIRHMKTTGTEIA